MRLRLVLTAVVCLALMGCLSFGYGRRQYRSNLLDYLSPRNTEARRVNAPSRLQLPLRIGIAFIPAGNSPIDAESEQRLLEIVRKAFSGREWVRDIRTIPSAYLLPHGGYDNLEQVSRMFGVDVMALVFRRSDSVQRSDRAVDPLHHIVGQYVLPGDRDDTRTLIDVAVLDVASRNFPSARARHEPDPRFQHSHRQRAAPPRKIGRRVADGDARPDEESRHRRLFVQSRSCWGPASRRRHHHP